ncbi:MAG TPA: lysophospholipid acyltransferase family protein [Candidatus Eremiobacteraceae bacterium]|nr:lysophospholipid acyltransferase family protein [Candidatus Eremiobacteraceae bacterium]
MTAVNGNGSTMVRESAREAEPVREWMEYAAAWTVLHSVGLLPRGMARAVGAGVARLFYALQPRLERAALVNLKIAFPVMPEAERRATARRLMRHIGWMGGEFSQFPRQTAESIRRVITIDGMENYEAAKARGKGLIYLTGHMGAWELAPFAQALNGHPLNFLVRPLENWRVNALVDRYRCLAGNRTIDKNEAVREMLRILRENGDVGVLMDVNSSLEEGVFVPFFGVPACTSSGVARIALRTDCAVMPGYVYWNEGERRYHLQLDPAIPLVRTGNMEADVVANTARFVQVFEEYARRYPDQWLWVHKRWKTRLPGEAPLYPF